MRAGVGERLTRRWLRLPRRTIRLRLTLIYGALFLVSGAMVLGMTYLLAAHTYSARFFLDTGNQGAVRVVIAKEVGGPLHVGVQRSGTAVTAQPPKAVAVKPPTAPPVKLVPPADARIPILAAPSKRVVVAAASRQAIAVRRQLFVDSGIALGGMALISIWLGWLMAGRALRPLRAIAGTTREITASSLHRRLDLTGPDDEVRQLGDTIDDLLARLEASFEAQRQFVANASHELRTPLTLERTLLEVALADPDADAASLRRTCEKVLAAGAQQERLIEALLTLSRGQRGLDRREPVDLAALAQAALDAADCEEISCVTALEPARTTGDARLVERLVANLVANAVRHNVPGGEVEVRTETHAGRAVLTVSNTGPIVPPEEVARLFEPFQRLTGGRTGAGDDGLGLGLSIVRAIADAHDAPIAARPRPGGGLHVEVGFASAARTTA